MYKMQCMSTWAATHMALLYLEAIHFRVVGGSSHKSHVKRPRQRDALRSEWGETLDQDYMLCTTMVKHEQIEAECELNAFR